MDTQPLLPKEQSEIELKSFDESHSIQNGKDVSY